MGKGYSPGGNVSRIDRKSTRLNSSHGYISYAVFCLKKKKKKKTQDKQQTITMGEALSEQTLFEAMNALDPGVAPLLRRLQASTTSDTYILPVRRCI